MDVGRKFESLLAFELLRRIRFPKTVFQPSLYPALPEVSGYMPPFFVDFFLLFFFVGTYFFTKSKSSNLT